MIQGHKTYFTWQNKVQNQSGKAHPWTHTHTHTHTNRSDSLKKHESLLIGVPNKNHLEMSVKVAVSLFRSSAPACSSLKLIPPLRLTSVSWRHALFQKLQTRFILRPSPLNDYPSLDFPLDRLLLFTFSRLVFLPIHSVVYDYHAPSSAKNLLWWEISWTHYKKI